MAYRKAVRMTRGSRRVFASKARESAKSLSHQFIMRGGGYL